MSDLKHKSSDELRDLIRWCEQKRTSMDEQKKLKQKLKTTLENDIIELGKSMHNIGQKETWARIYLARKD